MIKAAIIGSTGYVGAELTRILLGHDQVEICAKTSKSYAGKDYSSIYSHFEKIHDIKCQQEDIEAISETADVIFLALPHGLASNKINNDVLKKCKVIDVGADYRIKDLQVYKNWYKVEHGSEELLKQSVYGLCEWNRDKIQKAKLVANPGCYATCSILTLAPLLKEGLIDENSIVIDAKSGVSGAGRTLSTSSHYNECNESIKAYKIASHRHTPEIEQALQEISSKQAKITFTPHLTPMNRGILATVYASINKNTTYQAIYEAYKKHYGSEKFVRITKEGVFPETRWVKGSNFFDVGFTIDERTQRIVAVGAIDNLVKGAAGQAVQNMNIMFGLKEDKGISNIPIFPA